jgi:heme/copper-type cytochrome/quinol oxidase subunit 4
MTMKMEDLQSLTLKGVFPDAFKALSFLEKCQNSDGGISGMAQGTNSTDAPTAYVLQLLTRFQKVISDYKANPQQFQSLKEYLLGKGSPWKDMNNNANVHSTGRVTVALVESGVRPDDPVLSKAAEYLVSERNSDNGWGYRKGEDSYPYFTYFAAKALELVDKGKYSKYISEAAEFIFNGLQAKTWRSSPLNVALGTLLLLETGHRKYSAVIRQNITFLKEYIRKEPWGEDSYVTSHGLFPIRYYAPEMLHTFLASGLHPLDPEIWHIVRWMKRNQSDDGGWKWGTAEAVSWATAISLISLIEVVESVQKLGVKSIFIDAYLHLEEIRTSKVNTEDLERRYKEIRQRESQAFSMGRLAASMVGICLLALLTIYVSFVAWPLVAFLRGFISQRAASWISFILVSIAFLIPMPYLIYYSAKGRLERTKSVEIGWQIVAVLIVNIVLVIVFELFG